MSIIDRRGFLKYSAALGIGACSGAMFSGCNTSKKNTLRIGFLTPKTGVDSETGTSCERGASIARSFLASFDVDIEVVVADTESIPEIAMLKAEKLIHHGANCLVGAYNSATTALIAQVAESHRIPFVINMASADSITKQSFSYVFRNFPTSKMLAESSIRELHSLFALCHFKPMTASLIAPNDVYGQTMLSAFSEAHIQNELPFSLNTIIQYDGKAQDLSAEVAKLKKANADVLLVISRVYSTSLIIKELIKQQYSPKAIISPGGQGFYEEAFLSNFKKLSDYFYCINAWHNPKSELTQKAVQIFESYYPSKEFEQNVAFSLEAIYIAAMAFKQAQSTNPQDIQKALTNIKLDQGIIYGGPIEFDENGQRTNIGSVVLMNLNQVPRLVLPKNLAETEAVFPFPGF